LAECESEILGGDQSRCLWFEGCASSSSIFWPIHLAGGIKPM